jgi:hypothetical protein
MALGVEDDGRQIAGFFSMVGDVVLTGGLHRAEKARTVVSIVA